MEQSPPWEANRFSASQEIAIIFWNPKVLYRNHNCPPPVPILNQLDPVHTPTSYFLKIHFNIILPSTPGSPKWPLSLRFPHQNPECAFAIPHTRYMPRRSHSSRFCHPLLLPATIAVGSSNGVTSTRCCRYSCLHYRWWVVVLPETCRAVSR